MRALLSPHPDTPSAGITGVEVEIARAPVTLNLRYVVTGAIDDVAWPELAPSTRANELWKSTCFEAFLRPPDQAAYYELNFSPSTLWAAYRFARYREGMNNALSLGAPLIETKRKADRFEISVLLDTTDMPELPRGAVWRLGLSAVIEDRRGAKSYWALAHAPGKPDFHHSDCFAVELAPA